MGMPQIEQLPSLVEPENDFVQDWLCSVGKIRQFTLHALI